MAHVMWGIFLVWLAGLAVTLVALTGGSTADDMTGSETAAWMFFWFLLVPPLLIKVFIRGIWQAGKRIINL